MNEFNLNDPVVAANNIWVKDDHGKVLALIPKGTRTKVCGIDGDMCKVSVGDVNGNVIHWWVDSGDLTKI
jgi:hypothetical protein